MPVKGLAMMKATTSKSMVIKINLVFIACFLVAYAAVFLWPSSFYQKIAPPFIRCTLRNCHLKKDEDGFKMKAVLETKLHEKRTIYHEKPSFVDEIIRNKTIGLVNMGDYDEISGWAGVKKAVVVRFDRVSDLFKWKDLFPEWIDEEEDNDGPSCPEIPMPDFTMYEDMDVVVARLPCRYPEEGWRRDVLRLQIHLIAANLAVKKGKKGGEERMKVVFMSSCRPMMEIFRCDDLVKWDSDWWLYEPDIERLEQKLSMPVGSCKLALPLWGEGLIVDSA